MTWEGRRWTSLIQGWSKPNFIVMKQVEVGVDTGSWRHICVQMSLSHPVLSTVAWQGKCPSSSITVVVGNVQVPELRKTHARRNTV